jgi:hypothetical protein
VIAREVGIERAKTMTEADGPDRASYCGDPVTVREYASLHGAKMYELELTCGRETYPESHDDMVEGEPDAAAIEAQPVITTEGKKGPTYFVDISPAWRQRILVADCVGVDLRMPEPKRKIDLALLRKILGTLKTFPIQQPPEVCIEDLENQKIP